MSIEIRDIRNDSLVELTPDLEGLQVQTDFTDPRGRLVPGKFQSAKVLPDGRIGIKLTRRLNGADVLDSVAVPAGNDPFKRPFRTLVHVPSGNPVLERIS